MCSLFPYTPQPPLQKLRTSQQKWFLLQQKYLQCSVSEFFEQLELRADKYLPSLLISKNLLSVPSWSDSYRQCHSDYLQSGLPFQFGSPTVFNLVSIIMIKLKNCNYNNNNLWCNCYARFWTWFYDNNCFDMLSILLSLEAVNVFLYSYWE